MKRLLIPQKHLIIFWISILLQIFGFGSYLLYLTMKHNINVLASSLFILISLLELIGIMIYLIIMGKKQERIIYNLIE